MIRTIDITELDICQDCAIWIANADGSGMTEERLTEITTYMENNWAGYALSVSGEEADPFSAFTCDTCGTHIAGERFLAHAMPI